MSTDEPTDETEPTQLEKADLAPPTQPWADRWRKRDLLDALRRGDVDALHQVFFPDREEAPDLLHALQFLLEVRRQNIAVIGSHEAFVRHTEKGSLQQVVAPVRLSLHDDTLYRIPSRRVPYKKGTNNKCYDRDVPSWQKEWREEYDDPNQAKLTAAGYNRLNEVAGCSVALPPQVVVDGETKANPYIVRDDNDDMKRITLQVNVAGPSPLTGNLVVVQYVLNLDAQADLRAALMGILGSRGQDESEMDEMSNAVMLMHEAGWAAFRESLQGQAKWQWHWIRAHGPVGVAHNLQHSAVRRAYDNQISSGSNLFRKAQTVARRNAMRLHPALATQTVRIDDDGNATVRGIGWSIAHGDMETWARALDDAARGRMTPNVEMIAKNAGGEVEVISTQETYEPDPTPPEASFAPSDEDLKLDAETMARNQLLARMDDALTTLSSEQLREIGYRPDLTDSELLEVVERAEPLVNAALDAALRGN